MAFCKEVNSTHLEWISGYPFRDKEQLILENYGVIGQDKERLPNPSVMKPGMSVEEACCIMNITSENTFPDEL